MLMSMNDEVSSISSQFVDQTEVLPEVEVSKVIYSVMRKRQGDQRKHFFLEKRTP